MPGDGRYEWDGFLPALDLPHLADPPQGWFATANQDNLPRGYPFAVGFQWTDPFRFARIEEVLGSGRRFTMTDMMRLQQDELSLPARRSGAHAPGPEAAGGSGAAGRGAARCRGISCSTETRSPAAIYVAWEKAVKAAVWELVVPEKARAVFPRAAPLDREAHRLADGSRRPLRRRPDRRARRALAQGARPGRRRAGAAPRPGHGAAGSTARPS